ncbi:VOC family protein [Nonomuraea jabiensis]|uniref:hypothetical protein n=1 Tax=Nonomuraea jabiensis TaxID=882448 RepID=UPI003692D197
MTDIEQTCKELAAAGVHVTGPFHDATGAFHQAGDSGRVIGTHPQRASYGSFAAFADPYGNRWFPQEITEPMPGR